MEDPRTNIFGWIHLDWHFNNYAASNFFLPFFCAKLFMDQVFQKNDPNLFVDGAESSQHRLYTLTEAKKGR